VNKINDVILKYEELSFNAHPSLQTQFYDGWVLRFAGGYTNRANSINPVYPLSIDLRPDSISPVYPSIISLKDKIAECERRYYAQGLMAAFKLTKATDPNIEKTLEEQGYKSRDATYVMTMDLKNYKLPQSYPVCTITDRVNDEWLNAYFLLNEYSDDSKKEIAKRITECIKNPSVFGMLCKDAKTVACGKTVIERGYAALLSVAVDKEKRRQGLGEGICVSLLSEAKRLGAHTAYLQVAQENLSAVNLYVKLGFKPIYSYWYMAKAKI
jgi:ribosomal protein S18 acetylase RimI-like enzyme